MNDRIERWRDVQRRIATCRECCDSWPNEVICPLGADEMPDPPEEIDILFVGVAPTPQERGSKGKHFYSSPSDRLRGGLFSILSAEPFSLKVRQRDPDKNLSAFHEEKCFFVHAAKVRPISEDSPPPDAIVYCAKRHLLEEIELLQPRAVCILSKTQVGPVTADIFGRPISSEMERLTVGSWTGYVVLSPQPVRRGIPVSRVVLKQLWGKVGKWK